MPKDRRNLKSYQTTGWFNENRIVIKAAYRSVGDEIKEKCKQSNILYSYGGHCILGGDDEYKTEINQTGLKVKELAEWALDRFNTATRADVWIEDRPLQVSRISPCGTWPGKDTNLPPETNTVLVDGVPALKEKVQKLREMFWW